MVVASTDLDSGAIAAQHRRLMEMSRATEPRDLQAVLNLGAAVLLHGTLEPAHLAPMLRLVDPAVQCALRADHQRLEDDLALLRDLWRADPHSEDVVILSAAVLGRLRRHLERDQRTLYRPMQRLEDATSVDADPGGADGPDSRSE